MTLIRVISMCCVRVNTSVDAQTARAAEGSIRVIRVKSLVTFVDC